LDLEAAFDRFMASRRSMIPAVAPKRTSPMRCADALYRIGADSDRVFLRGIRHVQLEPVYGGKADTAMELRGVSALGLVRMGHADALVEIKLPTCWPTPKHRCASPRHAPSPTAQTTTVCPFCGSRS
jgi:hypothetical protein